MDAPALPHDAIAELAELHALIERGGARLSVQRIATVAHRDAALPVVAVALGNDDPALPGVAFVGGVHGLERIGARVVLAWLRHLVERLDWDDALHALLQRVRMLFVPVVNPGGIARGTRANPHGVDLMRNAPVDAEGAVPYLVGGQRISARLPWYRGMPGAPMEAEAAALCATIEREVSARPFGIVVDCHSGFGMRDRIWFPYAHTRAPIRHLPELLALAELFDRCHPQHRYLCEPQSRQYLAHGDLWDHVHRRLADDGRVLLPLTLEMGSWLWVRKNPRQLFSRHGIFNPLIAHREARVLRRHLPWFDFLVRAAASHAAWRPSPAQRCAQYERALQRWYPQAAR